MKMEIWCGRCSDGTFRIRVTDDEARTCFLEVKMLPENFANMLANQPQECEGEVHHLSRVGKKKVFEHRRAVFPCGESYASPDKEAIRKALILTASQQGWEMNDRLSSQGSFGYDHTKSEHIVNYTVEKWV